MFSRKPIELYPRAVVSQSGVILHPHITPRRYLWLSKLGEATGTLWVEVPSILHPRNSPPHQNHLIKVSVVPGLRSCSLGLQGQILSINTTSEA